MTPRRIPKWALPAAPRADTITENPEQKEPAMRQDLTLRRRGTPAMGRPFRPGDNALQRPSPVMAPGCGRLKEMDLLALAEQAMAAGYSIVSDHRYGARSGGQPRQQQR